MQPAFNDLYERLADLHKDMEAAVEGLPMEAIDWAPGPEMNSLGVLIAHTLGAEHYLLGAIVGQDPSARDRDAEFRATGVDAVTLQGHIREALAYCRDVIDGLSMADLDRTCLWLRDGKGRSVAFCLLRGIDHAALHLGHMQITHQLWEQAHP
jgi:hypothetical protein